MTGDTVPDRPGLMSVGEELLLAVAILRPGRSTFLIDIERLHARYSRAELLGDSAELTCARLEMVGVSIRLARIADTFQRAAIAMDRAARVAEMKEGHPRAPLS